MSMKCHSVLGGLFATLLVVPPAITAEQSGGAAGVVVLDTQDCSGEGVAKIGFVRHPDEAGILESRRLELEEIGYRVLLGATPELRGHVAGLRLHDRSRSVDDNYVLFSRNGVAPFTAAYVITRMEAAIPDPGAMLRAVMQHQQVQAGEAGTPSFVAADTPFGPGLEMIVGGRTGSACFPTSRFAYAASAELGTIGISRFVVNGADLVEYALVLPWPAQMPQPEIIARAQTAMDAFQAGLVRSD